MNLTPPTITLDAINHQIFGADATDERFYVTSISKKARQIIEALGDRVTLSPDGAGGTYITVKDRAIYANNVQPDLLSLLTCPNMRLREQAGVRVWQLWFTRGEKFPETLRKENLYLIAGFGKSVLATEIPLERLLEVEQ